MRSLFIKLLTVSFSLVSFMLCCIMALGLSFTVCVCGNHYAKGDSSAMDTPQREGSTCLRLLTVPDSAYEKATLSRDEPSSVMQHWTLAVMHASPKDPPEVVRAAAVMGFVYVSDVDEDRRKIKLLAPVGGRLGDRPLILGSWPEPYINLLG